MVSVMTEPGDVENIPRKLEDIYGTSNGKYGVHSLFFHRSQDIQVGKYLGEMKDDHKSLKQFVKRSRYIAGIGFMPLWEVECWNITSKSDRDYSNYCGARERFAVAFTDHIDDPLIYNRPLFSLLSQRPIVEPSNQPSALGRYQLWYASDRFFFFDNFNLFLGSMFQGGILQHIKREQMILRQYNEIVKNYAGVKGNNDNGKKWIWKSYADKVISRKVNFTREFYSERTEVESSIKIINVLVVLALVGFL